MTIKEHLTEPWGIVAGLVLGGMGAAVAAALRPSTVTAALMGVAIAAAVYTTKVGLAIAADRPRSKREAAPADARAWLTRATAAVEELQRHDRHGPRGTHRLPDGATGRAQRIIERLGQRADALAVVDAQLAWTDVGALDREHDRIDGAIAAMAEDSALRAEREISLQAVRARIASHDAQARMRALLLANMESTVLRLEAAVAQASLLASRRAVAETSAGPADELTTLSDELEAARLGLEETEELTRRVLGEA